LKNPLTNDVATAYTTGRQVEGKSFCACKDEMNGVVVLKHFKLFIKRFSLEINSKREGSEREINSKNFYKKEFCFRVEDYVVFLAKRKF
jgi:hypothetical protein